MIKSGNKEDFYLIKSTVFSEHFMKATSFVKDLSTSQWLPMVTQTAFVDCQTNLEVLHGAKLWANAFGSLCL